MTQEHLESTQNSTVFSFENPSQTYQSIDNREHSESAGSGMHHLDAPPTIDENVRVVWGTTINIHETIEQFKEFIRTYTQDEKHIYMEMMQKMHEVERYVMKIDCMHLKEEKYSSLYKTIINYPVETFPLLEIGATDLYLEKYPQKCVSIKIMIVSVDNKKEIKELLPSDIDSLIEITGMVTKISGILPDIITAVYVCSTCKNQISSEIVRGVIAEPVDCPCGEKFTMELDSSISTFQDKQLIKIQELPESAQDGFVPSTVTVLATSSLTDQVVPGDKIKVAGIYRAVPLRLNYLHSTIKTSFMTYFEMVSFVKTSAEEKPKDVFKALKKIEELRNEKDLYEKLASSIAPSIYGMLDVKKALLLQMFGGVTKTLNGSRFRGDVNVLLAGDPGVAKSQLLLAVHRLMDKGVYTCGRGSSAVGLTANVSRDPESGQYILEPGALVISDGGLCCVDEFDKMHESARSVLHEAMEQQTVSIAKAGIITTLNARCSIIAACNPIGSSYDPKKNIIENLNVPPTLLSRFDIVCLLLDKVNAERDKEISSHIIDLYAGKGSRREALVEQSVLKQYIKEGRRINPRILKETAERIVMGYQELRQLGDGKSVTATTRQLESIIRLSEAHARMRLSEVVEPADADEAVRLIKDSLHIYAIDPATGKIDMDLIHVGKTSAKLQMEEEVKGLVLKLVGKSITLPKLQEKLFPSTRITEKALISVLEELQEEGKVFIDGDCITPN